MKIGVLKEHEETRVAIAPPLVKTFKELGLEVLVEKGAGEKAYFDDTKFEEAGCELGSHEDVLKGSDILISFSQVMPKVRANKMKNIEEEPTSGLVTKLLLVRSINTISIYTNASQIKIKNIL